MMPPAATSPQAAVGSGIDLGSATPDSAVSKKGHPSAAPKARSLRGLSFPRGGVSENGRFLPPLAVSFGHGEQADWGSDLPAVSKDEGSQETDNQLLQLREFCEGWEGYDHRDFVAGGSAQAP